MIGHRHRPLFHLQPTSGWTNDPVGPVRWRDRYHLFHQANPDGGYWARPHWGHFVSDDLVRWRHRPLALSPDDDGPDADGCFSGTVVVDGDRACLFYTGASGPVGDGQRQVTCRAHSNDERLDVWKKLPQPVTEPPPDLDLVGFRDPFVWRHGDRWLQLVGSGLRDAGGALLLYESFDLERWTYCGPALLGEGEHVLGTWTGTMWECPALVPVDGCDLLLLSVHDDTTTHYPVAVPGHFRDCRFEPTSIQRFDLGPDFYAPCVLSDPVSGRSIVWGWSWEATPPEVQETAGWAGVLSLPRVVTYRDGRVLVRPLPELERLRKRPLPTVFVEGPPSWELDGVTSDTFELEIAVPESGRLDLSVLATPDGAEQTVIRLADGALWLDRQRASLDGRAAGGVVGGALPDRPSRMERLQVFVDRSVVEVFYAGASLTARVYPTRPDAKHIRVTGDLPPGPRTVVGWELGSIWDRASVRT